MAGSGREYEELHFGVAFANFTQKLLSLKQNASGWCGKPVIPALGSLRWEDHVSDASLGYTER